MTLNRTEQIRHEDASGPVSDSIRGSVAVGVIALFVLFAGFGGWAVTAPLDSAVMAPGQFEVENNRKTVKHRSGGMVSDVFVREGDRVAAGDLLIRIDDTEANSAAKLHGTRQFVLAATEARLQSERKGLDTVVFPPDLLDRASLDKEAVDAIAVQREAIATRKTALADTLAIHQRQIEQLDEVVIGARARMASGKRQKSLIAEELEGTRELYERGYAPKPRVLALERATARIDGEISDAMSQAARSAVAITEIRQTMQKLISDHAADIISQLESIQPDLAESRAAWLAAQHALKLTEIRAPVTGTVLGLRVHASGAVVNAGETILDIVPSEERLVIKAQVRPTDIDSVRTGAEVDVRLTAYNFREVPAVHGQVVNISADRLADADKGNSFFMVTVAVDLQDLPPRLGVDLYPGMPAEIMIHTGERSALDYLLEPLSRALNSAMREE